MDDDLEGNIQRALPSAAKMALYAAKKQNYEVLKYTLDGFESLCRNAALLKEYADEEHIAALDASAKAFVKLDAQVTAYKARLEKMEGDVERQRLDPADFETLVDVAAAEPTVDFARHEQYKRFCEQAGIELDAEGDEDVVFQQSESTRSTTCPVTLGEMENPVRNPSCGHTYSRKGIEAHLKRNRKCPVAGCPQKIVLSNLERDVEMEILIERRKTTTEQHLQAGNSATESTFRSRGAHPANSDDAGDDEEEEEYVVD
ncbi:hypothetical protein P43SY_003536 [Pythium insidiosum]|uniref:SP-RING-type domain-containing protein n=1 Tax=Pythium insidiosum TaxID=114742 RepID=A0AAD5M4P0_PYTIN|nr:hypothetical protein P43SY_003536 [Pythium insidiosum]